MEDRIILAIDLGKYKSVACIYGPAAGEFAFETILSDRESLRRLIEAHRPAVGESSAAVKLLQTIPGVGPRTAEAIVAFLGDPQRFRSGKESSAYAGLVPRQYQSGLTDRRGRISKRGPSVLRKLLVQAVWTMLRYQNGWALEVFARLTHGGKTRRKQAVARKLLVRSWAMLRTGQPWRSAPSAQPA